MTALKLQPVSTASGWLTAIAWVITLLASSLFDILWFELTGDQPAWIFWSKAAILVVLLLAGWFWKQIQPLRPFLIMILAIALLTGAQGWFLGSSIWQKWQKAQSFTLAVVAVQLIEMGVALLLVAVLFLLGKRRQDSFLTRGDIKASIAPVRWLRQKLPSPLWRFGLIFTLVVIVSQVFMFILPLKPTADIFGQLIPFIPLILLLAASNGFNEEVIFRAAPMAAVHEAVGESNAVWMAAILFGLAHFVGGTPSGIPGVLITTLLVVLSLISEVIRPKLNTETA